MHGLQNINKSCWTLSIKQLQRPMFLRFSQRCCGRFRSSGTWRCARNVGNHSSNDNSATFRTSTCFDHPHEDVKVMYSPFTTQGGETMILYVCMKPLRGFQKEINRFQYTRIQRWTTNPPTPLPTLYRTDSFETFVQILCKARQRV